MPTEPIHTTDSPTPPDPGTGEFTPGEAAPTDGTTGDPPQPTTKVVGTMDFVPEPPAPPSPPSVLATGEFETARSVTSRPARPKVEGTVDLEASRTGGASAAVGTCDHAPDGPTSPDKDHEAGRLGFAGTGTFDHASGRPAASGPPRPGDQRYNLEKVFARGGMGEVWLAEDTGVGRKVALKKMRKRMKGKEDQFFWEAQVTGQLEHPGVVPVHELGVDESGEPFYVMKLIKGQTLLEKIEAFHAAPADRPTREVERLELVQWFLNMCQTLAFAHARGVVHRDIKPENVMIGEYGETLVLDWGLAKVVGKDERAEEDGPLRRQSYSGTTMETLAGSVKGTPWYMAPEVAAGDTKNVDHLSDVYLLGATLYHLLTGKLPREGKSLPELISAAHKPPVPPRKLDPTIAKPLEAVCLKAMAIERGARYQSAKALTEDLQRYLAGEPVTAYRETFTERAWRWARRHRTAIGRVAAVVAVVAVVAAGYAQYRQMEAEAARKLQEAEDQRVADAAAAAEKQKKLQAEKDAAAAAAEKAAREDKARVDLKRFRQLAEETRYLAANTNPTSARTPFFNARAGLEKGKEALEQAAVWAPKLDNFPLDAERPALSRNLYDLLLLLAQIRAQADGPEAGKDVLALLSEADGLRPQTRSFHRLRAQALAALGQAAESQAEAKKAEDPATTLTASDHFLLGEQARVPATRPDEFQDRSGKFVPNQAAMGKALAEYQLALQLEPNHFWAHYQIGRCLINLNRSDEGTAALSACVALRPESPYGYNARGLALMMLKRVDDAAADLEKAVQLDPGSRRHKLNRGALAWFRGKTADALKDFDAALADPPEQQIPEAAFYKAQMFAQLGKVAEARAAVDRALKGKDPVGPAYLLRAQIHFAQGRDSEGIDDLNSFFAAADPSYNPKSAAAAAKRGRQLRLIGDTLSPGRTAVEAKQQADLKRRLFQLSATELETAVEHDATAEVLEDLGRIRELLGRAGDAVQAYTLALDKTPKEKAYEADRVRRLVLRGWAVQNLQPPDLAKARADFDAAIRLTPDNAEAHTGLGYVEACRSAGVNARRSAQIAVLYGPGDYLILHNVACIFAKLSEVESNRAREFEDTALDYLARAVELWNRDRSGPNELTLIRDESAFGKSLRARPEFKKLLGD